MTESKLVERMLRQLRRTYGGWWMKVHGSIFQIAGVPDIIGITRMKSQRQYAIFFAFEVKLPGHENELSRIQSYVIRKINKAGGVALMVTSINQIAEAVEGATHE